MYGTNPVAKRRTAEQGYLVHSIFYTIQGEGPWAGLPAIFLRLAGCNLQCAFCDTEFDRGAVVWTRDKLANEMLRLSEFNQCKRVVITGGEPMLQALTPLLGHMHYSGLLLQIETAGTAWPDDFEKIQRHVLIVCSPKTPKLHKKFLPEHIQCFKYIIQDGARFTIEGLPAGLAKPLGDVLDTVRPENILMQPCDDRDPIRTAANMRVAVALCMAHGYRLSVQVHKIAGVE